MRLSDPPRPRCPKSGRSYASRGVLAEHLRHSTSCGSKDRAFVCHKCQAAFTHPHKLLDHHHSAIACERRRRGGEREQALGATRPDSDSDPKDHDSKDQKDTEGKLQCAKCLRLYSNRDSWREHRNFSRSCGLRQREERCPRCGATFAKPYQLALHAKGRLACSIRIRQNALKSFVAAPGDSAQRASECSDTVGDHDESRSDGFDSGSRVAEAAIEPTYPSKELPLIRPMLITLPRLDPGSLPESSSRGLPSSSLSQSCQKLSQPDDASSNSSFNALPQSCPKCGKPLKSRDILLQHLKWSQSCGQKAKSFKCPKCGAAFHLASKLARHLRSPTACRKHLRTKELSAAIEASEKTTFGQVVRSESEAGSSEGSVASLRCPKCGKALPCRDSLGEHLRSSRRCGSRDDVFVCADCGADFAHRYELAAHVAAPRACHMRQRREQLRRLLGQSGEGRTKSVSTCPKCRRTYKSRRHLTQHLAISTSCGREGRSFQCAKCSAAFHHESRLRAHVDRPRACSVAIRHREMRPVLASGAGEGSIGSKTSLVDRKGEAENGDLEGPGEKDRESVEQPSVKRIVCTDCDVAFSSDILLDIHKRRDRACTQNM